MSEHKGRTDEEDPREMSARFMREAYAAVGAEMRAAGLDPQQARQDEIEGPGCTAAFDAAGVCRRCGQTWTFAHDTGRFVCRRCDGQMNLEEDETRPRFGDVEREQLLRLAQRIDRAAYGLGRPGTDRAAAAEAIGRYEAAWATFRQYVDGAEG